MAEVPALGVIPTYPTCSPTGLGQVPVLCCRVGQVSLGPTILCVDTVSLNGRGWIDTLGDLCTNIAGQEWTGYTSPHCSGVHTYPSSHCLPSNNQNPAILAQLLWLSEGICCPPSRHLKRGALRMNWFMVPRLLTAL